MFINILLILAVIIMTAFIILKSIQKKQNAEVEEKMCIKNLEKCNKIILL